jgi:uncharacterized protein (DUF736 family)
MRGRNQAALRTKETNMATIGTFTREGDNYTGSITTLSLKAKTVIKPVTKLSENAPDFRIYAAGVEIGAAWSATSKTDHRYLSVKLDDPSFAGAIYCRLIGIDSDNQTLIWNR